MREIWEEILVKIDAAKQIGDKAEHAKLKFDPQLGGAADLDTEQELLNEICRSLSNRDRLGGIRLALHPRWRKAISKWPAFCIILRRGRSILRHLRLL